jgi:hypothetical protein
MSPKAELLIGTFSLLFVAGLIIALIGETFR